MIAAEATWEGGKEAAGRVAEAGRAFGNGASAPHGEDAPGAAEDDLRARLAAAPLAPLMARLALPAVATQLVNLLYGIVDRIFIGHIPGVGADALAGVGVCLPIIMLVSSFSAFAGAGGAPLASIALGAGDRERAHAVLRTVIALLALFAVLLLAVFYLFKDALLLLFGASEATLPFASSYLSVYLLGTFFAMAYLGLSPFLLAQGDSRYALAAVSAGAVLHVALDALFIFGWGMGIVGAAMASVVSQGTSAVLVTAFLFRRGSVFRLKLKRGKAAPPRGIAGPVLALGGAPFFMQASESLMIVVLNGMLQAYGGDLHVSALAILQSALQLLFAPANGFTQGVQPIVSYNYGAGRVERVRQVARRLITVTFLFEFSCALIVIALRAPIAHLFTEDAQLAELVTRTMPVFLAGMSLFGLQSSIQSMFMGLGQSKLALTVAFTRKLVLLIPLALILPRFFGVAGVYVAEPVSDTLSVLFCSSLYLFSIKRILSATPPAGVRRTAAAEEGARGR